MQNSRGFRALKVWMALRQVGRSGYVQMIREDIELARQLYYLVAAQPELEAVTNNLSITTFRFVPTDLPAIGETNEDYLNELNRAILNEIEAGGEVFVSNAVVNDQFLLRACIVNFRTTAVDLEKLVEVVLRVGRATDAKLRPEKLRQIREA
jgi:glutamate/tyrosine decarboxylase-like PLP-dependent enzyme